MENKKITRYYPQLLIIVVTIITYALLITQMGFYWDDWSMLWFKITQGADSFKEAFLSDRPFLGYLYSATASILDNDPITWQIFTILSRTAVNVLFFAILTLFFDKNTEFCLWCALLLSIFPGFKQMPIAYVWSHGFLLLAFYLASYYLMLLSIREKNNKSRILYAIFGIILHILCTISTEYYTGLEVGRLLIAYIYISRTASEQSKIQSFKKAFLYTAPYWGVLAVFMFWRVFIFKFPSYQPVLLEQAAVSPLKSLTDIVVRALEDSLLSTVQVWWSVISFPNHMDFESKIGYIYWCAVICTFTAIYCIFRRIKNSNTNNINSLVVCGCGSVLTLLPGLPYWVTSLPLKTTYPYDRFFVAYMFGGTIFIVGFLYAILKNQNIIRIALSLLLGMSVGTALINANSYRKDWKMQKDFYVQLTTRIPDLKEGTLLLTNSNPLSYETDNSITGIVNLAYENHREKNNLPYLVQSFDSRYKNIAEFEEKESVTENYRSAKFTGNVNDVVVYMYPGNGCLRVIDPEQHGSLPIFPKNYQNILHLSNPKGQISKESNLNSVIANDIYKINDTDVNEWCVAFQKADLARQYEDWEEIAQIGDKVLDNAAAYNGSEYLPYIEAYIHTGNWEKALNLIQKTHELSPDLDGALCKNYRNLFYEFGIGTASEWNIIQNVNSVGCSLFD